ncbi:enoyl-CoA hydratase/isomerase family protein [Bradyrhizobium jicamae]|uniref:Enoyl-CoA hydratase/isomerase family protein n=1 Tax=Bradyrhizobium jicamae TaxID=280332 RepID=A0ABS5FRS2_9BRAD|nr:enoyl-CoA hydratase-related protein [Bradyrhizobium jicamae]MBR0799435.1 enoyl-CoA hydratase/isomerase family protein [Bradyrhizobium jicamae]MBR0938628.1 enoyl-CoA hydratase/isomerase family protein [Bradyrhizobium jicamae]
MSYEQITCEIDGPLMILTLNRPDKLNAYTGTMGAEVADAFHRADEDDAVRAIIVTGAGRAFCAGADVSGGAKSFDTSGSHGAGVFASSGQRSGRFIEAIFNCRKPSIAAINGAAVGVGITMTLPMDVRIAADGARIGFIFARRGLVPEAGSAWFLPKLVGLPQSLRWCLSGRTFDADEAHKGGLVSEVVTSAQLMERARQIAAEMTSETSAVSIALTRQMLWRFAGAPDPFELLAIDKPMSIERGGHADVREGVQSFMEKRKPAFPGKVSQDMPSQYPWWRTAK